MGTATMRSLLVGPAADAQIGEAHLAWPSFTPWASGMAASGHRVLETTLSSAQGYVVPLDVLLQGPGEAPMGVQVAP